ncbi:stage V sporulation protein D, partial [Eubacteriales bacterium OttesenSCG-928-M02]|nr:stage V sporulation protein D [Eubacteriales bacterium OttesenSCG-928-M02]
MPEPKRRRRALHMLVLFAVIFGLLFSRVFYLQVIQAEELQQKASGQWVRNKPLTPIRGTITDRNGEILAQSGTADTVMLRPKQIKQSKVNTEAEPEKAANMVADILSPILEMEREKIYSVAVDDSKSEVWLKRQLSKEQANAVREAISQYNLPGIAFTQDAKRYYPKGNFLTQVLGFTSVDGNGLEGLEAYYNKYLTGEEGKVSQESDLWGNAIAFGSEYLIPTTDGYTLTLTIDFSIQSYLEKAAEQAYEEFNAKGVWAIAMDPQTGEILALVNKPDYDLNTPPRDDAEALSAQSRNRIVTDYYEPGSVFKMFTTAAALEEGKVSTGSTFQCTGGRTVNGERIKCWSNHAGTLTLADAVAKSCNPCFIDMVRSMGVDTFYRYIHLFGFGEKTGVDATGESTGYVRDASGVRENDLARNGFGQAIGVTPIQMITAASSLLNGGTLYEPHLVKQVRDTSGEVVEDIQPEAKGQTISKATSDTMRTLLEGAGDPIRVDGYRVGGKSGTAQKYDENGQVMKNKHISSYLGFAPVDNPQIAVLFIVDEPETVG